MKQILYSKYNRTRKTEFQIGTRIYIEDGKRYVEKFALGEAAKSHIEDIEKWSDIFVDVYTNVKFQKVIRNENGAVVFEYLVGNKLSDVLSEKMDIKEEFVSVLSAYMNQVFTFNKNYIATFEKTEKFEVIFGDVDGLEELSAVSVCNPDMIFDNIFLCEDGMYLIDNEWGMDFPVPVSFIKYRTLHYFYVSHISELNEWMNEEEFLQTFGVEEKYLEIFQKMEQSFQEYTHGGRYTDQYIQNSVSFGELLEKKSEAEVARNRIPELQNEVEERNVHLKNLDKQIENLDKQIENRDKHIKMLGECIENTNRLVESLNKQIEELQICALREKELNQLVESLNEKIGILDKEPEFLRNEVQSLRNDNHAKQDYIEQLEQISEARRVELDQIRYYKKHPIRRMYRIFRRIGGKVWRKIKPIIKRTVPTMIHYKKVELPKYANPKVSIVIPAYNEFDYTYACINSIIENVKNVSYEIIVGDDESIDATKRIKKIIKNVKVNINHTDHGFLMNCNRAAELAEGEYIVFLNNDTLVKENWLESLVTLIESDEKIGMVGSKFVYPDGRLQEAGGIVWKDASAWNYGRYQDPNQPQFNYVRDVDYISGASIMLSKKLWDEIGGFDKQFIPAYCEDTDIAFEVRKRGYRVVYQPKSVVVHFEGVSNGTDLDAGLKKYQVENQKKFKEKWAKELATHNANGENVFWAKDQHQRRKTVLFIDHYVPTFDKDAGSRTVYQYIKIFVEKGYNVKFLGDNFYQSEPYASILEQMGVEVLYGVWYRDHIFEWLEENKDNIDFAFMNRPHITKNYIDFLKEKTNIRLMYYGHDLHYLRAKREAEFSNDDEKIKEANMWKAAEFDIMRKVDAVYYLSYVEKDAILEEDSNINVKTIMVNIFEKFLDDINYDFNTRKDILFVGGFSHTPNVDAICWFVKEVFPQIHTALGINLYVVGSNAPDEVKELEGNGVIIKGFVSDEELHELYGTARIAVVPLRYGAGVKGKVIEALYQGCPLVITSVGAEGIPEIEKLADVKDEPEEFAKAVIDLYGNTEELKRRAMGSQEYVKTSYSVDAAWKIIEEDFT